MQTSGKAVLAQGGFIHFAAGGHGNHRNGLCLRNVGSTQEFYQIEAVDSGHLYVCQQYIENGSAELFDKFFQLLATYCVNAVLFQHGCCQAELDFVIINQEDTDYFHQRNGSCGFIHSRSFVFRR